MKKKTLKYCGETEDIRIWNNFLCSWIDKINTINMVILPKAIYKANIIPIKITTQFITALERQFLSLYGNTHTHQIQMRQTENRIDKSILNNKRNTM